MKWIALYIVCAVAIDVLGFTLFSPVGEGYACYAKESMNWAEELRLKHRGYTVSDDGWAWQAPGVRCSMSATVEDWKFMNIRGAAAELDPLP